jgi:hypothetical protein
MPPRRPISANVSHDPMCSFSFFRSPVFALLPGEF